MPRVQTAPLPADRQFEERADYIAPADLKNWNVDNEFFRKIQRELLGRGAKLLIGPRGCGKTHQIRLAHTKCVHQGGLPFSAYVSFSRYLWLEPRLGTSPGAIHDFHTWVLCKILISALETCDALDRRVEPPVPEDQLKQYIGQMEKGFAADSHAEVVRQVTISETISFIEQATFASDRRRSIILMDDAALTLTPEYMVEFFEVFRSLKTSMISPKASVYPGTTEYGPRFHVGHDARPVNCWLAVDSPDYQQFMGELLATRLGNAVGDSIGGAFLYAAFGLPRIFIALVRSFTCADRHMTTQARFNQAIEERTSQIEAEYRSLAQKLPKYRTIIDAGWELFRQCIEQLVSVNRKLAARRQLMVGIEAGNDDLKLAKMIKLLREVGLLYERGTVSHGDRDYVRYIPHVLFLVEARAFNPTRGFSPESISARIGSRAAPKHPLRRSFTTLLSPDTLKNLRLDVPECASCNVPRLSEDQRFCHNCGAPLVRTSTFEACMNVRIEELRLPKYQVENLLSGTQIRTIGDIVMLEDPATEIRKARLVGPVRAPKIYETAMSFIAEYLER